MFPDAAALRLLGREAAMRFYFMGHTKESAGIRGSRDDESSREFYISSITHYLY